MKVASHPNLDAIAANSLALHPTNAAAATVERELDFTNAAYTIIASYGNEGRYGAVLKMLQSHI